MASFVFDDRARAELLRFMDEERKRFEETLQRSAETSMALCRLVDREHDLRLRELKLHESQSSIVYYILFNLIEFRKSCRESQCNPNRKRISLSVENYWKNRLWNALDDWEKLNTKEEPNNDISS